VETEEYCAHDELFGGTTGRHDKPFGVERATLRDELRAERDESPRPCAPTLGARETVRGTASAKVRQLRFSTVAQQAEKATAKPVCEMFAAVERYRR